MSRLINYNRVKGKFVRGINNPHACSCRGALLLADTRSDLRTGDNAKDRSAFSGKLFLDLLLPENETIVTARPSHEPPLSPHPVHTCRLPPLSLGSGFSYSCFPPLPFVSWEGLTFFTGWDCDLYGCEI
ncbi:uncharacterized [Tachysurus ichikawai]